MKDNIDSDSEDFYDALCDTCRYVRVAPFFEPPGTAESVHEDISYILSNHPSCNLCQLIGHAVHVSACAQVGLPPPPPSELHLFKPEEMFPDMQSSLVYIRANESHWVADRAYIESIEKGTDVQYLLKANRLSGQPAGLRFTVVVELGVLQAITAEIMLLGADTKYLDNVTPSYHAQIVDKRVDVGQLRMLLDTSCAQHPKCHSSTTSPSQYPKDIRMIDTFEHCIIHISQVDKPEYVALSYTWGGDQQFKLLLENVSQWSHPGGLPALELLPRTIRDSISLCRELQRRYLWIDSLCIVQNDPTTIRGQLEQMSLIYQCAEFTLVAASGTGADAGLPGISTDREPCQLIEKVQGLRLAVPLPSLQESAKYSFWKTRAWTYQEQMLSGNILAFTERQMFFECKTELFSEDHIPELPADATNTDKVVLYKGEGLNGLERLHIHNNSEMNSEAEDNTPFNSFHLYRTAVSTYTTRNLTNLTDILNAFTGVVDAFQDYAGVRGFVGGLSVMGLPDALLWCSARGARLTRRLPNDPATGRPFPTWSWAGWIGPVTIDRESDMLTREVVVAKWEAIYHPVGEYEPTTINLQSVDINEDKPGDSIVSHQWKLLHAHILRLQTYISSAFRVVLRPHNKWSVKCSWDVYESSQPHAACILDEVGDCIGYAHFDNPDTAESAFQQTYTIVALSKGWHPKAHHTRQFSMQDEGAVPVYNIVIGTSRPAVVERNGVGKILASKWPIDSQDLQPVQVNLV